MNDHNLNQKWFKIKITPHKNPKKCIVFAKPRIMVKFFRKTVEFNKPISLHALNPSFAVNEEFVLLPKADGADIKIKLKGSRGKTNLKYNEWVNIFLLKSPKEAKC